MAAVHSPHVYDSLLMLADAGEAFEAKQGRNLIEQFHSLFTQHGIEHTFGLMLNHRHFDLSPTERLVEYNGTSVPCESLLEKTRPSSWLLSEDNACSPFEFYYCGGAEADESFESPNDPKYIAFISSLNEILRNHGALGLFCLCRYLGDDLEGRVEITGWCTKALDFS